VFSCGTSIFAKPVTDSVPTEAVPPIPVTETLSEILFLAPKGISEKEAKPNILYL
tara:strand:- start:870 stop:1034 length:165 start_codon:yes stop_codon:yes gene_type:complete